MKKAYNFNAGPCVLPQSAIAAGIDALRDFKGSGMSVVEISHRSKDWEAVMTECDTLWRELLHIPDNYRILFLGGGASMQFLMVPYNLLERKAAYLETGVWAKKAFTEARLLGGDAAIKVASSAERNYSYIPKGYEIPHDADYFHITTNNTIYGTEIHEDYDSPALLVADMSSDIMSRPVDIRKYGLIYGGAQKNVGTAGVTFVIIREDILGRVSRPLPTMLDYRTHIKNASMFNTPPVFPILIMNETLKWIKAQGGVPHIYQQNLEKATLLYNEIDRNKLFTGTAAQEDRSLMNICFVMNKEHADKEDAFLTFAKERGMVGIKGHRSVGGFRASTYNACPTESIKALITCMQEFEKNTLQPSK
ncbi:MAG: 3-phosphoserine/phosphohydroxythreonine transaminase [Prevotellaceae bacterium]|nr:3-phosphoserine/phosphohydroxythreonine transaminase [Prevotellaceae bacterium]